MLQPSEFHDHNLNLYRFLGEGWGIHAISYIISIKFIEMYLKLYRNSVKQTIQYDCIVNNFISITYALIIIGTSN